MLWKIRIQIDIIFLLSILLADNAKVDIKYEQRFNAQDSATLSIGFCGSLLKERFNGQTDVSLFNPFSAEYFGQYF